MKYLLICISLLYTSISFGQTIDQLDPVTQPSVGDRIEVKQGALHSNGTDKRMTFGQAFSVIPFGTKDEGTIITSTIPQYYKFTGVGVTASYSNGTVTIDIPGGSTSGITGITGDGFASGPGVANFTLSNTGVVAGTFTNPVVTVDSKGRVVSITNGSSSSGITSIGLTVPSGFNLNTNTLTSNGGFVISTNLNGPIRGNGSGFTVGNINLGTEVTGNLSVSNLNNGSGAGVGTFWRGDGVWASPPSGGGAGVSSIGLTSSDITVGGASPITGSGAWTLTLPTINPNVGSFNTVSVNAKGQVTGATNVTYLQNYYISPGSNIGITGSGTFADPKVIVNTMTPGGAPGEVQYNGGGYFAANGLFYYNQVGGVQLKASAPTGNAGLSLMSNDGTSGASFFYGDVSNSGYPNTLVVGPRKAGGKLLFVHDISGAEMGRFDTDQSFKIGDGSTFPLIVKSVSSGSAVTMSSLAGTGTRMVVADATGTLFTQAIPSGGGGSGSVTSVTAGAGLSGGTITTTGTISLANTAVTPGTYTYSTFTVDAQGRITGASSNPAPTGTVFAVTAGTGLSGGTITNSGTINIANTGVAPGSYTNSNVTVNAQGQITSISNGSGGGSALAINNNVLYRVLTANGGSTSIDARSGMTIDGFGNVALSSLASSSTQMVVASSTGVLSVQAIPTGGGAGDGGVLSMNPIGSTPNSFGGSIAGTVQTLQPFSSAFGGVMTTGAQVWSGDKYAGPNGSTATGTASQKTSYKFWLEGSAWNGSAATTNDIGIWNSLSTSVNNFSEFQVGTGTGTILLRMASDGSYVTLDNTSTVLRVGTTDRIGFGSGSTIKLPSVAGGGVRVLTTANDGTVGVLAGSSTQYVRADGQFVNFPLIFGNVGSSPNAQGASVSGVTATLQPANELYPGLVTTDAAGSQFFSGNKGLGQNGVNATSTATQKSSYGMFFRANVWNGSSAVNSEIAITNSASNTVSSFSEFKISQVGGSDLLQIANNGAYVNLPSSATVLRAGGFDRIGFVGSGSSSIYLPSLSTSFAGGTGNRMVMADPSGVLVVANYTPADDNNVIHRLGSLTETANGNKNFSDGLGIGLDASSNPVYPSGTTLINASKTFVSTSAQAYHGMLLGTIGNPSGNTSTTWENRGIYVNARSVGSNISFATTGGTFLGVNNTIGVTNPITIGTRTGISSTLTTAATAHTAAAYGSVSWAQSGLTGGSSSSIFIIDTLYNYFSQSPFMNDPSTFTVSNLYGYFCADFSQVQATVPNDNSRKDVATVSNKWQFYARGGQKSDVASYFGNKVGIGYTFNPTTPASINALLEIGNPASGDALRVDGGVSRFQGKVVQDNAANKFILKSADGNCWALTPANGTGSTTTMTLNSTPCP